MVTITGATRPTITSLLIRHTAQLRCSANSWTASMPTIWQSSWIWSSTTLPDSTPRINSIPTATTSSTTPGSMPLRRTPMSSTRTGTTTSPRHARCSRAALTTGSMSTRWTASVWISATASAAKPRTPLRISITTTIMPSHPIMPTLSLSTGATRWIPNARSLSRKACSAGIILTTPTPS